MEERDGYIWVPYREWLANIENPRYGISTPFDWVVKHYTPNQEATSLDHAITLCRNIWHFHTYSAEGSGWGWIGYNTLQYSKYIFEGAGIGNRGIHAPGANGQSHGHAFLVSSRDVSDVEWLAFRALIRDVVRWGYLSSKVLNSSAYNTNHQDWISTTCPGPVVNSASKFYTLPDLSAPAVIAKGEPLRPFKRSTTFDDFVIVDGQMFGLRNCEVYDFPKVPNGWTVVVQQAESATPFNVVPYELGRMTDDVDLTYWGAPYEYRAKGNAVAICVPIGAKVNIEAVPA